MTLTSFALIFLFMFVLSDLFGRFVRLDIAILHLLSVRFVVTYRGL